MNDETILAGFANLHQAMTTGFDQLRSELRSEMATGFREVRSGIAALETRTVRRFDAVDERLERIERRIDVLEPLVRDHDRRIAALESPG